MARKVKELRGFQRLSVPSYSKESKFTGHFQPSVGNGLRFAKFFQLEKLPDQGFQLGGSLQKTHGIFGLAHVAHFVMQVRPGGAARAARPADHVS